MKKPLVSVLMPNYNGSKYLSEAIESILNQTYTNFEFIIVDDCSTDDSWSIINSYAKKDKRIRAYRNQENLGRPKTRNKLLSLISNNSSYFMWMDSDDVVKNKIIEIKTEYLEKNKNISGLGSAIDYVDENLNFIKRRFYPKTDKEIKKVFLLFNPLSQGGLMLRSFLKDEKYDLNFLVSQDYEMWTRLISKGYMFENLEKIFYYYRQFPNQGKQKNLKLTIKNTIKIKSKYILKHFSLKAGLRFLMECILLLLPKKTILWLFYKFNK